MRRGRMRRGRGRRSFYKTAKRTRKLNRVTRGGFRL